MTLDSPTVRSYGGAVSYERGTHVLSIDNVWRPVCGYPGYGHIRRQGYEAPKVDSLKLPHCAQVRKVRKSFKGAASILDDAAAALEVSLSKDEL